MSSAAKPLSPIDVPVARPARRRRIDRFTLCLGTATVIETGLVAAAAMQLLTPFMAGVLHVLVAPLVWIATRGHNDDTMRAIAFVSLLVLGPIGGIGALFLARVGNNPSPDPTLDGWYDTLAAGTRTVDSVTALSEHIREDRARHAGRARPRQFDRVMSEGSTSEQQALLGLISQRFAPEYAPILKNALRSERAIVRVSAAAVYAKLRDGDRKRLVAASTHGDVLDPAAQLQRAETIASVAMNGLLEESDLAAPMASALEDLLSLRRNPTKSDATEELICRLLFLSGHEADIWSRLARMDVSSSAVLSELKASGKLKAQRKGRIAPLVPGTEVQGTLIDSTVEDGALLAGRAASKRSTGPVRGSVR